MGYKSVGIISNCSDKEITVYLEMLCEEIKVAPNLSFELFIEDTTTEGFPSSLPIAFNYIEDGIQIYPNRGCGKWKIIFNGKEIIPDYPTVLSEYV